MLLLNSYTTAFSLPKSSYSSLFSIIPANAETKYKLSQQVAAFSFQFSFHWPARTIELPSVVH